MAKKKLDKISQDMIENIKNYANEIETLETFVAAVRQMPGMYIGSIGDKGLLNLIREIAQNGFDEVNKDSSPATGILLSFDERSQTTIVEDNGRGIPFGEMERIFAKEHTSSNYTKKPFEYSSGLHGVGAKVTNALSSKFIVESFILGKARKIEFNDGVIWDKGEVEIPNKENKQGTRISFVPSKKIMGETHITVDNVYNLVNLILPLTKIGTVVIFNGIQSNGKTYSEKLVNEDGIMTYFIDTVKKPLVKPIHLFKDSGYIRAEVVFTYDIGVMDDVNSNDTTKMFAFCNTCPTTVGTHIDGYYDGICYFFTNYMNKIYLVKNDGSTNKKSKNKKKLSVTFNDVKFGLTTVLASCHLKPTFDGQSKEKLSNEDAYPFTKNAVMDELDRWSKENASDLNKICKYLKDVAEMRVKADQEKVKVAKKYNSNPLSGLPSNFVAPLEKKGEKLELWIVEGDSAAGSLQNDRSSNQGYFPIRGKIADAFKKSRSAFLSNEEVAGIIAIILDGVKDYDINQIGRKPIPVDKIKWDKIIFGTDADSDGDHISALLLRFFMMYMPELIIAGKIYKSQPPLYGMIVPGKATGKYKKHKIKYFLNRAEYIEYIQKYFMDKYKLTDINDKPLNQNQSAKFFLMNYDYTYELEDVASNHSIPPELLEDLMILKDEPYKNFCKKLKSKYRFINVDKQKDTLIITGSVDGAIRTVFLNNILIKECKKALDILNKNSSFVYKLNGEYSGIYNIMHLFDTVNPSNIQRYKGLGEMNGPKLFDSTLNPETRVLVRYTVQNATDCINKMKFYNNNMRDLLSEIKVSRFDVLD